ncbi:MAG: topoisomerase C-terminal repeat-containing protein, partial [Saprospiraceae bacterium]
AIDLFKLPLTVGQYNGEDLVVNSGRYGPYIKYKEKFVSIPRGEDPLELTLERAQELVEEKLKQDAPVASYKGNEVTKGKGRFGPFLKWNDLYINIPRRINPDTITQEEIFELIEAKIQKEANRYISQWPEENIALENGRWGPFIRYKKKSFKIEKKDDGERYTAEEAKEKFTLEEVKKLLKEQGAKGIK